MFIKREINVSVNAMREACKHRGHTSSFHIPHQIGEEVHCFTNVWPHLNLVDTFLNP